MKKFYLLLLAIFSIAAITNAQSSANYAYTTNNDGSLSVDLNSNPVNMATGTTQLIGAGLDAAASPVTTIPFDFYLMGTRFNQFSVNEDGVLQLGGTVVGTNVYSISGGTAAAPRLGAFNSDMRTGTTTGKVHYKINGTAPNRVLVIEFLNMQLFYNSAGTAGTSTFQMRLYETTGVIEYVYGTMSATDVANTTDRAASIGFYTGAATNAFASVLFAGHTVSTTAPYAANPNIAATGPITNLTSAADGSRRYYRFTPPAPTAAPTGLSFTAVTAIGMTLNWTDNASNEVGYAIYRSDDGGTTYNYISQAAANATSSIQSGLASNTNYFWRVYAVTEGRLSSALQSNQLTNPPLNITSVTPGGLWSQTTTWSTGTVPTNADNVTILSGHTVTIDIAAVALSLTVNGGGTLQYEQTTARTLTVGGNVTIDNGGIFQSNTAGTVVTHVLSLSGSLTNNGTLDFSTNADVAGAGITFTGAGNTTFGGTGTTTDVRIITINKGTSQANILELNPTNFSVRGTTTDAVVGGWLVMTNGTIKVSGTFTGQSRVFATAGYTIPTTFGFWLNNPNYTVTAQAGNAVNNGLFRLTQGTFNQGTLATHSFRAGTGAIFTIEGGTLNCASQFSPQNAVTYNQSSGTVNVGLVGNSQSNFGTFELFSGTSTFTMSGGAINIVQASTGGTQIDYQNLAVSTITGGTLNIGTGATVTKFSFTIKGNIPNLVIDNTTNNKTLTAFGQINLLRSTLIKTGTTFTINGQTCLILGTPFTNNGTLTGTAAATRFYFLGGQGATTYTGTGVVTVPLTAFEVDNVAGVTIDPAVNQIVAIRYNNFSGGVTGSGKLTLGNGAATTAVVQLGVTGVTNPITGFDVPPVFNPGTGGVNLLYAPELTGRTTGNEIPPSRTLNLLSVTNTNPITLAGGDITVTGTTAGSIALGVAQVITNANTLYFNTTTGTVTRTTGYVNGNFKKNFAAAASKIFEVGTTNGYSPVTVNATAGTFPTEVTIKPVQTSQPNIASTNALQRYWTITATGITADLTFNYLAGDVNGTEANYKVVKVEAGVATSFPASTVNTATHVGNVTGISSFSDWTLAEACTGATGGTATGNAAFCTSGTPTITASGYSATAGYLYQWQSSNDNFAANIVDIAAQTNPAALTTGVVTATTYYRLRVTCPFGPAVDYSNIITVTVTTPPSATIAYTGSPYCNVGTAAPTQTGTTGGTYSSTAGLFINASTGQINLLASTPATYTVTYTVAAAGGCALYTTTTSIVINPCAPPVITVTATSGNTGPVGYTTLKLAFDAVNDGTHQGDVTINVNGSTNEGTTPAVLNGSGGTSSYTSVLIRPTMDAVSISAGTIATLRGVIELNGADNVTIDGDNPNSVGINRDLTVTLTGTTTSSALIWINSASAADGATNNTIRNCIIAGQSNTNTTIGILGSGSTFGNAAAIGNSNITINNNAFLRTQNGIYWNGFGTAPNYDANLAITNNNFGSTVAADKHIFRGMILQNVSNFTVSGNTIQGISSTTTSISNMSGIQLFGNGNGGNIFGNKISDIKQTNTTGYGAAGINLGFSTTTSGVNVYNNFISDVTGQGWLGTSTSTNGFSPSDNGYGIAITNGGGYNIYYNTVHMNTNQANNGNPAALLINETLIPATPPANSFNIRNNIFTNSQTTGTNRFSVISVHANTVFTDINYNDYFTTGPNLGNYGGTNRANLAAVQTATGKDANSVRVAPVFISATDLHLATTGNCALDGTATPIATVPNDIDNAVRNVTIPDIGADEFASAPRTATIAYTATPYCVSGGTATVTQTGTTGGVYSAPAAVTINATTGAITLGTSTAGTYTITYTVPALGACPVVTTTTSITINAAPSATISYAGSPYCQNAGTANVTQTGSTGGTYSSTGGLIINATTGAVTLGTSTPGTYTVTYTIAAANGCAVYTTTTSITITAPPTATISYTGSPYCQNAGTATVTQTGTAGGAYSSTAGLTINTTTGAVTTTSSTPGTYTVTYTVAAAGGCAVFTTTASITITATPSATISYAGTPYCQNAGTANITRTGTAGGTYSSTAGLTINTTTGAVTTTSSTPGTYTVTYTVAAAGGCAVFTTTTSITITATPSATISYAGSPYCGTGTATVTRTGTAGGSYSSTAGISINATTGDVNLATSTPGTYTVTYTVAAAGGCAVYTTTTSITINTTSTAPTGATTSVTTNCGPATGVVLSVTGGSLGTGGSWKWYSGSCGGTLVGTGASITLNVAATTTYFVRAEGTCNTTTCASVTVTINTQPTISIAASPYTALMPTLTTVLTATINPVVAGNVIVWYKDGVIVPGATTNTLTVTVDDLGAYRARVTSPFFCTALSNEVVITDSATDKVFIYPNPNAGSFHIRYYTSAHNFGFLRQVLIYDSKGAIVYNKRIPITAPYSAMDIDLRKNGKGIYMVVLADYQGKPLTEGKVVIQ